MNLNFRRKKKIGPRMHGERLASNRKKPCSLRLRRKSGWKEWLILMLDVPLALVLMGICMAPWGSNLHFYHFCVPPSHRDLQASWAQSHLSFLPGHCANGCRSRRNLLNVLGTSDIQGCLLGLSWRTAGLPGLCSEKAALSCDAGEPQLVFEGKNTSLDTCLLESLFLQF